MLNKAVFSLGALLALLAFGGIFLFGQVFSPPAILVMAARVDLQAGAKLADLPESDVVTLPLRGDSTLISSLVTEAEYTRFRESGAVLLEAVHAHEPLRKSALISSANAAASSSSQSLRLSDPSQMIIRLTISDNAPDVRVGDLLDLGLAVGEIQAKPQVASVLALPPVNTSSAFLPPGVGRDMLPGEATATASPSPTVTPTPEIQGPLAKIIVHAAVVTNVVRDRPSSAGNAQNGVPPESGPIIAIDVMIPSATFEMVTMAQAAGKLTIGLLSPLASRNEGPTGGASMTDFLNWFYADRARLTPQVEVEAPGQSPSTPTPGASLTAAPISTPLSTPTVSSETPTGKPTGERR